MSINNTLLIVGKSFSELERYIVSRGDNFLVLKDSASAPTEPSKTSLPIDFSNEKLLWKTVDSLAGRVNGILCVYEAYVNTAADIAATLKLPGMTKRSAEICTDKFLMRQALAKAEQAISARYALIDSQESLVNFARQNGFPLIIKPANLTKSLLVSKCHDMAELLEKYEQTIAVVDKVYARYAPGRRPKLLVEEFLEGPIYSVDAFVDAGGTAHVLNEIVDYQTGYDIGYDDNFHYSRLLPTGLNPDRQKNLRKVAKLGAEALGMRSSPAHIEIIYTSDGPRIVEIGARNGGYRELMHRLANGIDIYGLALDLALGNKPNIKASKNEYCAVLELFPEESGKFAGVHGQKTMETLPSLVSFKLKRKIGDHAGKSSEGYKMCAIVVLHNKDQEQFNKDLDFVNNSVYVLTKRL